VSSPNPKAIQPVLESRITSAKGFVRPLSNGFELEMALEGDSAVDLNRRLLADLQRAEQHTRVRSEWVSEQGGRERFLDCMPRSTVPAVRRHR
jgi:hypothetical protein